jgi:hypothetical protein
VFRFRLCQWSFAILQRLFNAVKQWWHEVTNSKSINTFSNNGLRVGISQKVVDQIQDLRSSSEIGEIKIPKAANRVQSEIHLRVRRPPVKEVTSAKVLSREE